MKYYNWEGDDDPPEGECRGYLPMDCPNCGRHRLEYYVNEKGAVINVVCEKCRVWNWEREDVS